jgi:hypothetical protein
VIVLTEAIGETKSHWLSQLAKASGYARLLQFRGKRCLFSRDQCEEVTEAEHARSFISEASLTGT